MTIQVALNIWFLDFLFVKIIIQQEIFEFNIDEF